MKKVYVTPKLSTIVIETASVIATSGSEIAVTGTNATIEIDEESEYGGEFY